LTFSALVGAMSLAHAISDESLSRVIDSDTEDGGRASEESRLRTLGSSKGVTIFDT